MSPKRMVSVQQPDASWRETLAVAADIQELAQKCIPHMLAIAHTSSVEEFCVDLCKPLLAQDEVFAGSHWP